VYVFGALCVLAACIWGHFLPEGNMQIFGMAVLLGFGNSIILVMSLSMTTRLIGTATVRLILANKITTYRVIRRTCTVSVWFG